MPSFRECANAGRQPQILQGIAAPPYAAKAPGNAQQGAAAFATFCASCHGADGKGTAKVGSIVNPNYLSLITDQGLRTIVIIGRPDFNAPDWRNNVPGHPMSDQDISDVVAWLAAQRPNAYGDYSCCFDDCDYCARRTALSDQEKGGMSRRRLLAKLGMLLNGLAVVILATPVVGYLLGSDRARRWRTLSQVDRPGRTGRISRRPDQAGEVQESDLQSLGRRDRQHSLLGAPHSGRNVPGLCHQLRAPGMPGALVPAVGPVHVSLPWRSVLPGRLARLRSTSARAV